MTTTVEQLAETMQAVPVVDEWKWTKTGMPLDLYGKENAIVIHASSANPASSGLRIYLESNMIRYEGHMNAGFVARVVYSWQKIVDAWIERKVTPPAAGETHHPITWPAIEGIARRIAEEVCKELLKQQSPDGRIQAAIAGILRKCPGVVRVRYNKGTDHDGDPCFYFRVVISDDLAQDSKKLLAQCEQIRGEIFEAVQETDLFPFINFRSVGEQALLKEPDWE